MCREAKKKTKQQQQQLISYLSALGSQHPSLISILTLILPLFLLHPTNPRFSLAQATITLSTETQNPHSSSTLLHHPFSPSTNPNKIIGIRYGGFLAPLLLRLHFPHSINFLGKTNLLNASLVGNRQSVTPSWLTEFVAITTLDKRPRLRERCVSRWECKRIKF